jgi:hypothetical protein
VLGTTAGAARCRPWHDPPTRPARRPHSRVRAGCMNESDRVLGTHRPRTPSWTPTGLGCPRTTRGVNVAGRSWVVSGTAGDFYWLSTPTGGVGSGSSRRATPNPGRSADT